MTTTETTHTTTSQGATVHHWLYRSTGAEVNEDSPAWMMITSYVFLDHEGNEDGDSGMTDLEVDGAADITSPELASAVARHLGVDAVSFGPGFRGDDPYGNLTHSIEAS